MGRRYHPCYLKIRFDNSITIVSNHNAEIFFLNGTAKDILLGFADYKTLEEIIDTIYQKNPSMDFKRIEEDAVKTTEFMVAAKILYAE